MRDAALGAVLGLLTNIELRLFSASPGRGGSQGGPYAKKILSPSRHTDKIEKKTRNPHFLAFSVDGRWFKGANHFSRMKRNGKKESRFMKVTLGLAPDSAGLHVTQFPGFARGKGCLGKEPEIHRPLQLAARKVSSLSALVLPPPAGQGPAGGGGAG